MAQGCPQPVPSLSPELACGLGRRQRRVGEPCGEPRPRAAADSRTSLCSRAVPGRARGPCREHRLTKSSFCFFLCIFLGPLGCSCCFCFVFYVCYFLLHDSDLSLALFYCEAVRYQKAVSVSPVCLSFVCDLSAHPFTALHPLPRRYRQNRS